jgi:hypothetical protein
MSGLGGAPAALPGDAGRCRRRTGFLVRGGLRSRGGLGSRIWSVRRGSRATIWATRAGWRGAVRLGAGRFGLRRPSSVRLTSLAQRSRGATTSGKMAARSTAFGSCRQRERTSRAAAASVGRWDILLGQRRVPAYAARRRFAGRVSVPSGRPKGKARRSHSLPLLTYSGLGGLRQDPGRAAGSLAGPRTGEDMGARRACVVVDLWGTR